MIHALPLVRLTGILVCLLLCSACGKQYKKGLTYVEPRQAYPGDMPLTRYSFYWGAASQEALYRCTIKGTSFFKRMQLSGHLRLQYNSDKQSARAVFTAGSGKTFFDFEYLFYDSFAVHRINPPFTKPGLLRAVRQDIDLLMALTQNMQHTYLRGDTSYYSAKSYGDLAYFVADPTTNQLQRIDIVHKRLSARILPVPAMQGKSMPDSFNVHHYKAHFMLSAKKIAATGKATKQFKP